MLRNNSYSIRGNKKKKTHTVIIIVHQTINVHDYMVPLKMGKRLKMTFGLAKKKKKQFAAIQL